MNGFKSIESQSMYYSAILCDKPAGHNEISMDDYNTKKAVAQSKKHHGVLDGQDPDPEGFFTNPILRFELGKECLKVCD